MVLVIKDLVKKYTKKKILDHINLTIEDGGYISLIGESGCGKSTLCRLILGFESFDSGSILWNDKNIHRIPKKIYYKDIQAVFQDNASCFNPRLKIIDILIEPMVHYTHMTASEMHQEALSLLEKVELSGKVMNQYPHELSGGMRKRVCIARAISARPKLILFDEIISGLDAKTSVKILELIKRIQSEEMFSYIFISHNLKAVLDMSNTIAVMKDGRISNIVNNAMSINDISNLYR